MKDIKYYSISKKLSNIETIDIDKDLENNIKVNKDSQEKLKSIEVESFES